MSDSLLPLLKEIIAALDGDTTLFALVADRIYTDVPDNETFPYVTVQINSGDYSTKETPGMEHTVQCNIYSRKKEPQECGNIRAAIYDILNRGETALAAAGVINIQFNGIATMAKDTDGQTHLGVIQFRAVIL